jgi:hypothetical protein
MQVQNRVSASTWRCVLDLQGFFYIGQQKASFYPYKEDLVSNFIEKMTADPLFNFSPAPLSVLHNDPSYLSSF